MLGLRPLILVMLLAALVTACASNGVEGTSASFVPAGENPPVPGAGARSPSDSGNYAMSVDEQELDCKRLTGKIQIRILELRTYANSSQTSALSRGLQAVTTPVLGGSSSGIDPGGEHAREVAQVQAYNNALADKDCRSFDLAAAMSSNEIPPTPTVPPRSKQAPLAKGTP